MGDQETFKALNKKCFKEQAIWMLNALWPTYKDTMAEEVWGFSQMFSEFEIENHENGCDLDELNMHRVFEKLGNQKTVQEMRSQLKQAGVENFKRVGMLHFLTYYYGMDWHKVANAPQGDNSAQVEKAQQLLDEVSKQLELCQKRAEEAKKSAEAAAARQKEAQAAEDEVTKALNEVKAQEQAKEDKRKALQKKIETAGLVAKNAAIQELAKLDNEDDLPLRRAKTTLEAAQRKAAKAVKIATEAKEKAESDSQVAEKAVEDTQKKVAEAEAYLKEVQLSAGSAGQGTMWWMQRELEEKKKYMPMKKGGIAKK
uniref:TolA protein, putative n=1 Tax=Entamoeba histolytica TaxID=5759 RepID=A0A060N680_ENTHI|nr:TolA protein, putative [Entamoeba histolytica]